jgi:hypothetical protein
MEAWRTLKQGALEKYGYTDPDSVLNLVRKRIERQHITLCTSAHSAHIGTVLLQNTPLLHFAVLAMAAQVALPNAAPGTSLCLQPILHSSAGMAP